MTPAATIHAKNCLSRATSIKRGLELLLLEYGTWGFIDAAETQLDLLVDDFAALKRQMREDDQFERLASITERAMRSHPRI